MARTYSVLFVCLGNICRSPLAEGVFRQRAQERELGDQVVCDSAATSRWEIGNPPDPRTVANAASHGVRLQHKARQVTVADYDQYDRILVMDDNNFADLKALLSAHGRNHDKVGYLRDYDPEPGNGQVPDPYYGGPDDFEKVFQLVDRSVQGLLDHLKAQGLV